MITLDTTRADRPGCYGYAPAETPVLDALAARDLLRAELTSRMAQWPSLEGVAAAAHPLDPEA
jgi:hypothetical protein